MRHYRYCAALLLSISALAMADERADPASLDASAAKPATRIAVLGTVHLTEAPKSFQAASLAPLLERLARYQPQIITVEQLSGEECERMLHQPDRYAPDEAHLYCGDTSDAKAATGLDVAAASVEMRHLLKSWPAQPTAMQRRHLAAVFMAANDETSALVQWLQLPAAERHAGDGLDGKLTKALDAHSRENSESSLIAAPLAARLGLQRVYPVDDHSGDNVDLDDGAAFGQAIQHAWDGAAATMQPIRQQQQALWQANDMLGLYRYINRVDVRRSSMQADFGSALRDASPQHYGRIYVAGWETRNLRMAANVHEAFRESPGARVLSIVGAQHKAWFDSLLGQMQGVQIVDVESLLK